MRSDWLDAFHVLDSSFPTGAYAHSFGLEALAPVNASQLRAMLALRIEAQLARLELVFVGCAYAEDLLMLDLRLHAMLLVRETRDASASIGSHLLRAACEVFADPRLHAFLRNGPHHHQPVAFGGLAAALDLPRGLAAQAYAFSSVRSQVSAAQRLGWIGQRDAQHIMHSLKPAMRAAVVEADHLDLNEAGAFAPAWDLASMAHERADARLFAS
jgi:urease accessory protein